MIKLLYTTILLFAILILNAQETPDSLHIEIDNKPMEYVFDAMFFEHYFPLSGTFNNEQLKVSQFLSAESIKDAPYLNTYQSQNMFLYKSPLFEYWRMDSPLSMGFHFNLNSLTGWEKTNIFIDGNAHLLNIYEINESGHAVQHQFEQGVYWELGGGISHEFSPGKKLFIRSSIMFRNNEPKGRRHLGGINMKF